MTSWSFQPIFDSYLVVLVASAVLIGLLALSPNFTAITLRRRWTLISLRLAIIALVMLAMLRPTRVSSSNKPQAASLLVLADLSRSMQLPHESGGRSRWDAERETLSAIGPVLSRLARQMDVKIYGYDSELRRLEMTGGIIQLPAQPLGQQTDIGSTMSDAVRQELGRRIAAVVVIGDGAQTAVEPRVEVYDAARELARLGFPLYTVALGPATLTEHYFADPNGIESVKNSPVQLSVFPNPVGDHTVLKYKVDQASKVEVGIFDVLGKEVSVLVNENKTPGEYEILLTLPDGLESGFYFVHLQANGVTHSISFIRY